MAADRWFKAKEIFGAAIDIDPSQREAYVRQAAKGDAELFAEVIALLEKDSSAAFFKNPIDQPQRAPVVLEGRYRIETELGRGGFGIVYLARDQKLHDRKVVIKMPLIQSPTDTWPSEKFAEEIRALARIDHPGVVGALDRGSCPDGRPFFVMQFVEGRPLRETIVVGGMPFGRVAEIAAQIGRALGAAHKGNVWHRDLKPENIMLQSLPDGGEQVRLIDFGIATVKDAHDAAQDIQTRIVGSLSYMAPEQLSGHVNEASDLYAFGLIVYEMLTGRKPFAGSSPGELLAQQKAGAQGPRLLRPELPRETERLVFQALSYEPGGRPQDAAKLGEEVAHSLTIAAPDASTRRMLLSGSIGVCLAAGVTSAIWWRSRPGIPAPSLTCSLMIQRMRDGQPSGLPQFLADDQSVRTTDSFLMLVRASQPGHLYLLSEELGKDSINILFPAPFMYGGSSLLNAGELKRIPEDSSFAFDNEPAVMVLWGVWSADEIAQFQALERWINERDRGALGDAGERALVRSTLARLPQAVPIAKKGQSGRAMKIAAPQLAWNIRLATKA